MLEAFKKDFYDTERECYKTKGIGDYVQSIKDMKAAAQQDDDLAAAMGNARIGQASQPFGLSSVVCQPRILFCLVACLVCFVIIILIIIVFVIVTIIIIIITIAFVID